MVQTYFVFDKETTTRHLGTDESEKKRQEHWTRHNSPSPKPPRRGSAGNKFLDFNKQDRGCVVCRFGCNPLFLNVSPLSHTGDLPERIILVKKWCGSSYPSLFSIHLIRLRHQTKTTKKPSEPILTLHDDKIDSRHVVMRRLSCWAEREINCNKTNKTSKKKFYV